MHEVLSLNLYGEVGSYILENQKKKFRKVRVCQHIQSLYRIRC